MMLTQADQTSISTWETTVRTAGSLCSFGTNADEFMRDEFLFGLNDSFSGFRDDIFTDTASENQKTPLSL